MTAIAVMAGYFVKAEQMCCQGLNSDEAANLSYFDDMVQQSSNTHCGPHYTFQLLWKLEKRPLVLQRQRPLSGAVPVVIAAHGAFKQFVYAGSFDADAVSFSFIDPAHCQVYHLCRTPSSLEILKVLYVDTAL